MAEVTEAMIDAAWSREQEPVAQLVTIRSDADPAPIVATDWPEGIVSNGVTYPHYPFQLAWAGASRDAPFGQGKLTIDTAKDQKVNFFSPVEWQLLREDVVKYGIRNSNITAIAPTATIANIVGTTECIQLINERVIIKDNLSGRFDQINPLHKYNRPELVKTVWEVDQLWSIKAAARRQKWIDQSQSLNLYKTKDIKGRTLDIWYTTAWKLDVKTTYYLRNQGATDGAARIEDVKQEVLTPPVPAAEQPVTSYFECEACQ